MPEAFDDPWKKIDAAVRVKLAEERGCEPNAIPPSTPADVASALMADYMADARAECLARLNALQVGSFLQGTIHEDGSIELPPTMYMSCLCAGITRFGGQPLQPAWEKYWETGFTGAHTAFRKAQDAGADIKHPLAALIKGWLVDRPVPPDKRATAIIPATLSRVRDVVAAPAALFDLPDYEQTPGFAPRPELQGYLPGLAPDHSEWTSPLPLLMWDASTEGGPKRGKGAPLALRTWIEAVLSLPVDMRFVIRVVETEWREFTNWMMPNGRYQRADFPSIMRALHSVHNLRLPWDQNGVGGLWAAVQVRTFPRAWNAYDSPVRFEVDLPPGVNDRGPLVYRPALRELGQQSALRYRAYLGLCYQWDRYGARNGRYVQPTRPHLARDREDRILNAKKEIITGKDGQPVWMWTVSGRDGQRKARPEIVPLDAAGNPVALTDAAQERNPAADLYPILSPAQLVELCYSPTQERLTPSAIRSRRERAQDAIRLMAKAGYCIIEDVDGGFRILPPRGWGAGFDS